MKKIIFILVLLTGFATVSNAQEYALIDTEYILKNIPSYQTATAELEKQTKQWRSEISKKQQEVKDMYKSYQASLKTLSAAQKTQKENAIVAKETEIQELNKKYFGPEGELEKKQKELLKPINDKIYIAVKELSEAYGLQLVLDRATATSVIFASPEIDISNEVLAKLGYSK